MYNIIKFLDNEGDFHAHAVANPEMVWGPGVGGYLNHPLSPNYFIYDQLGKLIKSNSIDQISTPYPKFWICPCLCDPSRSRLRILVKSV